MELDSPLPSLPQTAFDIRRSLTCVADQDSSIFRLPSHSLEVDTTYEFRVDVTDNAAYSSFATQVCRTADSGS